MRALLLALVLATATTFLGFKSVAQEFNSQAAASTLRFKSGTVVAQATWEKGPQSPAESVLRLQWENELNAPVELPGTFGVKLMMPGMGHGSAPVKIEHAVDASGNPIVGDYVVSRLYFTMGGKWEVNVSVRFADGTQETQTLLIDVE